LKIAAELELEARLAVGAVGGEARIYQLASKSDIGLV
jgi:hypothetical protein